MELSTVHWGSRPTPPPPSHDTGPRSARAPHRAHTPAQSSLPHSWLGDPSPGRELKQRQRGREPRGSGNWLRRSRLPRCRGCTGRRGGKRSGIPVCHQKHSQMVLSQANFILQQCCVVALDPLRCSPQQLGEELLQHHCVDDPLGVMLFFLQPPPAGIVELLGKCKRSACRITNSAGFGQHAAKWLISHLGTPAFWQWTAAVLQAGPLHTRAAVTEPLAALPAIPTPLWLIQTAPKRSVDHHEAPPW